MNVKLSPISYKGLNKLFVDKDLCSFKQGKNRAFDTGETLKRIWPLRHTMGITRISDLTELDYIGIPVVSAIRPTVDKAQITATQGKGLKKIDAITSAIMESAERFSCANYKNIHFACYEPENSNYLIPNVLNTHRWNKKLIEWVSSKNILTDDAIFIPAADVLFPYYASSEEVERPVRPSTTGVSSGNTHAEALLHSIFEVIERDTTSKFIVENSEANLLDLESVKTPTEKRILETFKAAKIDILVFDLSLISPIPVFYASILNSEGIGPDVACAGQGAHLLPEVALRRALTEAAQSRVIALQGSREDLIRHDSNWVGAFQYYKDRREKMKQRALNTAGLKTMPIKSADNSLSVRTMLSNTLFQLGGAGFKTIYYTDLTNPKINIPVIHTCIPGMVDLVVEPERVRVN